MASDPIKELAQALINLSRPNSRPASPTPSAPSLEEFTVPLQSSEHKELLTRLDNIQNDVTLVVGETEDIKDDILEKISLARTEILKCRRQVQDLQHEARTRASKCQSRCILFLLGSMIFVTLSLLVYNTFMDKFERAFGK